MGVRRRGRYAGRRAEGYEYGGGERRTEAGEKKELEERCGETEAGMWMENSALFLSGRPMPQQRSERGRAAETNRDEEERAGTRERGRRRGNRRESEHDKK